MMYFTDFLGCRIVERICKLKSLKNNLIIIFANNFVIIDLFIVLRTECISW